MTWAIFVPARSLLCLAPVATVLSGGLMAIAVAAGGFLLFPALRKLDRITDAEPDS